MTQEYLYIEDLQVGQKFKGGPVKVSQEDIIAFGKQFDPQDFHTDPIKAKDTAFGQLVASGWHTAALTMRMILAAIPKIKGGMIGRTIEKLEFPRPVLPGDEISLEVEVLELRVSENKPGRGIMRTKNIVRNQKDEIVMRMETVAFVPQREKIS